MDTYVKIHPFAFGPYDVESGTNPQVKCRASQSFGFHQIFVSLTHFGKFTSLLNRSLSGVPTRTR